MKRQLIFICLLLTASAVIAQNVGIGTTNPADLLHIKDGMLRLEGNNKFFNLHTTTPNATGFRFYTNGAYEGGWFYRGSDQILNLTNNGNINGFVYDLENNRAYLGRDFQIGSEVFGVRAPTTGYGGMYMETSGETGQPFYGYATDSIGRMWHYYHGTTNSWRVNLGGDKLTLNGLGYFGIGTVSPNDRLHVMNNIRLDGATTALRFYDGTTSKGQLQFNGNHVFLTNFMNGGTINMTTGGANRLIVENDGDIGISTLSPISRLHVFGNAWDLANSDGIFAIGAAAERLAFGMAIDGAGAGTGRIYAKGTSNKLILGGGANDVLSVLGTEKRIGIGTNFPAYTLEIQSAESRGISVHNNYSGASTKFGGRFEAEAGGSGTRYGIWGEAFGTSGLSSTVYGGRFYANGNGNTGAAYGIYAQVASPGNGNHYAIYATANTSHANENAHSWALYADGHSYFDNDVRIGTLNGATGYRLSVDGKIMSEELKVQMSANWPDYVFEEDYDLMTLDEIDGYIKEYKHLPGVPSAKEVEEAEGFHVGEMNRILLEKVEEFTLLLIEQNKKIEQLEKEIKILKAN